MATIEYLEKRISGKVLEIEKLQKKLARIEKAKSTNWENNPYYYSESDIRYTTRDINLAETQLQKYKEDLEEAKSKANSRNVPAITEFLDRWEENCIEYFRAEFEKYAIEKQEYYKKNKELSELYNYSNSREERKQTLEEMHKLRERFNSTWSHVTQFMHGNEDWDTTMLKDIKKEKDRKYDDLLERICSVVGTIEDASNLYVGRKGDINGFVVGDKGKASVETIGAGGYNIQVFHFRTLVHKIK